MGHALSQFVTCSFDSVAKMASQEMRGEFLKQSSLGLGPKLNRVSSTSYSLVQVALLDPLPFMKWLEIPQSRIAPNKKAHREYGGVAFMPKTPDWRQLLMTENEDSSWHDSSHFFAPWLAPARWYAMICHDLPWYAMICPNVHRQREISLDPGSFRFCSFCFHKPVLFLISRDVKAQADTDSAFQVWRDRTNIDESQESWNNFRPCFLLIKLEDTERACSHLQIIYHL